MRLQKIVLSNFQGVKAAEYNFYGNDSAVYGTNASGKTTIANAFMWLLFDRSYNDTPGYSPKPHNSIGGDIHNVNSRVDGTFTLGDGRIITLAKELYEVWTKKRGSQLESFTGNATNYYIDGVPVQKKEYDSKVAELCPVNLAKILTNPAHFAATLPWQERRKILLEVCGDISDIEVIGSTDELHDLLKYLEIPGTVGQYHTVDEYKKIAAAEKSKINEELSRLPERIDEANKAIPDISGIDVSATKAAIAKLEYEREELTVQLTTHTDSDTMAKLRRQVSDIGVKISEARAAHNYFFGEFLNDYNKMHALLMAECETARAEVARCTNNTNSLTQQLSRIKSDRENLSEMYARWKSKEWQGDTICPTCRQPLPAGEIEAAREKFNMDKAQRLEDIRTKIEQTCSKTMIAATENQLQEAQKIEVVASAAYKESDTNLRTHPKPTITPFENTPDYIDLSAKKAQIEAQMSDLLSGTSAVKDEIRNKISEVSARISELGNNLYVIEAAEVQKKRVAELVEREKQLAQKYDSVTYGIYLCELFIKTKVSMLTERINDKFESVKFRLFEEQINGGLKECCEVLVPSANSLDDYRSSANSAAKLNAGLEIIDTLSRHFGCDMPVIIDNAESVVTVRKIDAQVIRLIVSAAHDKLAVEVA